MIADEIVSLSNQELQDLLRAGHPIDPFALDNTEYEGTALGLPRFIVRLTWKRFRKSFYRDPRSGLLRGWNVRIDNRLPGWQPVMRGGAPLSFGHYAVRPAAGYRVPRGASAGLVLDYGQGCVGWRRFGPMACVRDPLVAVQKGDATLLLGWTYLTLGIWQLPTPSFFLLQRGGPVQVPVPVPGVAG